MTTEEVVRGKREKSKKHLVSLKTNCSYIRKRILTMAEFKKS